MRHRVPTAGPLLAFALLVAAVCPGSAGAQTTTLDFDGFADGTVITTVGDLTASGSSVAAVPLTLVVSSGLDTPSTPRYLGVDDLPDALFISGDEIAFSFAVPVTSLSLSVVSSPGSDPDAFKLETPVGSDASGAPDLTFPSGDELFTLAVSGAPFTTATLRSNELDLVAFHVDDIVTLPEPGLAPSLGAGLSLLALLARRRDPRRAR